VTGDWKKVHNEALHNVYSSPSIIRMIMLRKMRLAKHVARMVTKSSTCTSLMGKSEGKRPLGRPSRRLENNIKMDLREIGWGGMDWTHQAQDRDSGRLLWTRH
jgi:hypothetical protein